MTDYLKYVQPDRVGGEGLSTHIASDQRGFPKVQPGDTIWQCTVTDDKRLFLLSRLKVAWTGSRADAVGRAGAVPHILDEGEWHALGDPATAELTRWVDITMVAAYLRFNSEDAPQLDTRNGVNAQQLQTMRELQPVGASVLKREWELGLGLDE